MNVTHKNDKSSEGQLNIVAYIRHGETSCPSANISARQHHREGLGEE